MADIEGLLRAPQADAKRPIFEHRAQLRSTVAVDLTEGGKPQKNPRGTGEPCTTSFNTSFKFENQHRIIPRTQVVTHNGHTLCYQLSRNHQKFASSSAVQLFCKPRLHDVNSNLDI